MTNIKEKKPVGAPPHKPTPETRAIVEKNSGFGLPKRMIATLIGVNEKTMEKYYEKELREGEAKANGLVAGTLFKKCMEGDTASILFWHKCRMGFREKDREEAKTSATDFVKALTEVAAKLKV